MPLYLTQVAYTPEAWKALVNNPHNRLEAIRPAIEKLGGKIVSGYFAFGDFDVIAIAEMPDHVAAAAFAMAIAAGGACRNVKTTPQLDDGRRVGGAEAGGQERLSAGECGRGRDGVMAQGSRRSKQR